MTKYRNAKKKPHQIAISQGLKLSWARRKAAEANAADTIFDRLPKDVVKILYSYLHGRMPKAQIAAMMKQLNDVYESKKQSLLLEDQNEPENPASRPG